MKKRLHAVVHGYVQGVGFRAFVLREARRLGLAGFVRNRADGAVEVVVEGEQPVLDELLRDLYRGPSESEVQRVEANWSIAKGEFATFRVVF